MYQCANVITCRVTPDLAPELEAIGDRLRDTRHSQCDAFQRVILNTRVQGSARETDRPQLGRGNAGGMGFVGNRYPDFERRLSCESVKSQCCKQTEKSAGRALSHGDQGGMLSRQVIGQRVETAVNAFNVSGTDEARKLGPVDSVRSKLRRPQCGALSSELVELAKWFGHGRIVP